MADREASWAGIARKPTSVEAAVLTETLEKMVQSMTERQRRVFELRLQGYTASEISSLV